MKNIESKANHHRALTNDKKRNFTLVGQETFLILLLPFLLMFLLGFAPTSWEQT